MKLIRIIPKKRILILLALAFIIPNYIFAGAFVPLTNFFSRGTLLYAIILTIIIIFLEAGFLKAFIKKIPFRKHILFSAIINIVSSAIGSFVILLTKSRSDLFYFDKVFVLLFILTIVFEFPIIKLLYRQNITWLKNLWVDFVINTLSYISLIIMQTLLLSINKIK